MSKVVAKVKELWNQKVTQFETEEKMDSYFKNYNNITIGFILDQTNLVTFSYTIKLPDESIPDYNTMYEKNQGVKSNFLLVFNKYSVTFLFLMLCLIFNEYSIWWFLTTEFPSYSKSLEVLAVMNFYINTSSPHSSY